MRIRCPSSRDGTGGEGRGVQLPQSSSRAPWTAGTQQSRRACTCTPCAQLPAWMMFLIKLFWGIPGPVGNKWYSVCSPHSTRCLRPYCSVLRAVQCNALNVTHCNVQHVSTHWRSFSQRRFYWWMRFYQSILLLTALGNMAPYSNGQYCQYCSLLHWEY